MELEADSDMSDEVLDKFGDCLNVTEQKSSVFTVSVKLRPSPPFYAWIAMHRGKIRIKSPEAVKEGMRDFLSHTYYEHMQPRIKKSGVFSFICFNVHSRPVKPL